MAQDWLEFSKRGREILQKMRETGSKISEVSSPNCAQHEALKSRCRCREYEDTCGSSNSSLLMDQRVCHKACVRVSHANARQRILQNPGR
jgi:hypothetical protein